MADEGTSFTIDLPVTGQDKIDAASRSIDVLAARLDAASKAVKAGEASYRVAEVSADRAAKALEKVGIAAQEQRLKLQQAQRAGDERSIQRSTNALELLADREKRASAAVAKTKTALDSEAASLDKLKAGLDKAEKAHKAATSAEEKHEPAFATIGRGLNKLGGPLAELGDHVTRTGEGFAKLRKGLGGAGFYVAIATAVTALVASVVALGVAAVTAVAKIAAFGIELADARGHAERLAQAMLFGSRTGGAALNDQINALTRKLPLTQEEIASTARGLAYMGLRGKALNDQLERSAMWAARLKFGPDFMDEMLSLDEQSKVFHANLAQLFGGLKVNPLLTALQKMIGLLDANSASGRAIKVVFESMFQPLIDWVAASEPKIEAFFLKLEILALKAAIQFKLHFSTIAAVVKFFAVGAAVVLGVLAVAAAVAFVPLALLVGVIVGAAAAVGKLAIAIYGGFGKAVEYLKGLSLEGIGRAMIAGLIRGIKAAGSGILDAMKGAVTGAVDAVEKTLGIQSPSKVFAEIGFMTGAGMAQGVDRATPGVRTALEGMTAPPTVGSAAPAPPAPAQTAAATGGSSISGNTFIFNGVKGAEDALERFGDVMTRLVEGDAAQLGAVPAGGGPNA